MDTMIDMREQQPFDLSRPEHSLNYLAPLLERVPLLVVDDDAAITCMLRDVLESAGYRVLVAANGRTALAIARREHPAMVLTDRMMPELDGVEFARRLRAHPATRDIPVVLMSSTRPDRETLGSIPFLPKPFELDELLTVIGMYLVGHVGHVEDGSGPTYG